MELTSANLEERAEVLPRVEDFRNSIRLNMFWTPKSIVLICDKVRMDVILRDFVLDASARFLSYVVGIQAAKIPFEVINALIINGVTESSQTRLGTELTAEYKVDPERIQKEPFWLVFVFLYKLWGYSAPVQTEE